MLFNIFLLETDVIEQKTSAQTFNILLLVVVGKKYLVTIRVELVVFLPSNLLGTDTLIIVSKHLA